MPSRVQVSSTHSWHSVVTQYRDKSPGHWVRKVTVPTRSFLMEKGFYIIRNDLTAFAGSHPSDHLWVGRVYRHLATVYKTRHDADYVAKKLRKKWSFTIDTVQFYN